MESEFFWLHCYYYKMKLIFPMSFLQRKAIKAEIANPATSSNRRNFMKKAALGGIALGRTHASVY